MKKQIVSSIFIALLITGCSLYKGVLRSGDSSGIVNIQDKYGRSLKFYIVQPKQLLRAKNKKTLTYLGSEGNYHLFRVWSNITATDDIIHFFAVKQDQCIVESEGTIEEEQILQDTTRHFYRSIEIKDEKCIVRVFKIDLW